MKQILVLLLVFGVGCSTPAMAQDRSERRPNMHQWTLFSDTKTTGHRKRNPSCLAYERGWTQIAPDIAPVQVGLRFWNAAAGGSWLHAHNEECSETHEDHAEELRGLYENRKLNFPTITIGNKKLRNPSDEELQKWINKLME